jgi:hypothetical protein
MLDLARRIVPGRWKRALKRRLGALMLYRRNDLMPPIDPTVDRVYAST